VLKEQPVQPVPAHLRDKGGQASKRLGHGKGYDYSHDFPENISGQNYLEKPLALYTPKPVGWETKIADRLARWKALKVQMRGK
jgi:putative ATPase